jgi:hypothetical protein
LNRPEFYIFDRDNQSPTAPKYQQTIAEINQRPNCEVVVTDKKEMENYLHPDAITAVRADVVISYGDFDSVPELVAKAVHNNSDSPKTWDELSDEKKGKKISKAKVWLNAQASAAMTPELLDAVDPNNNLRNWFSKIDGLLDAAFS